MEKYRVFNKQDLSEDYFNTISEAMNCVLSLIEQGVDKSDIYISEKVVKYVIIDNSSNSGDDKYFIGYSNEITYEESALKFSSKKTAKRYMKTLKMTDKKWASIKKIFIYK